MSEQEQTSKSEPLGQPIAVTERIGYQLMSRVWKGRIRYSARIGRIYTAKTGQPSVWSEVDEYTADDYIEATNTVRAKLRDLRHAAHTHRQRIAQNGHVSESGSAPVGPDFADNG